MSASSPASAETLIIHKYQNRRLYDAHEGRYITLDDVAAMVVKGIDFVVVSVPGEEDVTHSVLMQIIAEHESKNEPMLPLGFLNPLIRFYGDAMGSALSLYLDACMQAFAVNRQHLRDQMRLWKAFHNQGPLPHLPWPGLESGRSNGGDESTDGQQRSQPAATGGAPDPQHPAQPSAPPAKATRTSKN